ncbi:MAG TPA: signal peptidase I [Actinomycetota bacterium]|nr:signal peptidase I [Actinomycetota bacterium]
MTGRPPGADRPAEASVGTAPTDTTELPEEDLEKPKPRKSLARELPVLVLFALVLALLLKTFVVQAFFIPSRSMVPTLQHGDRILVNRLAYRFGDIHRGDVVVFTDPTANEDRGLIGGLTHWFVDGLGVASTEDFVKRVIGLPGDAIEIDNGSVFVNGRKIQEPYLNANRDTSDFKPITVPPGMLFVLGDNRTESGDSRFPPPGGVGFVPVDHVVGKVAVIVWPLSRMGWVN